MRVLSNALLVALTLSLTIPPSPPLVPVAESACCYFSAKDQDVVQPGQKVFITWDPESRTETFTVQPKFEGNAADFGMVIPTPSRPKLDEMPRDFFKELAVFTILKKREHPHSRLVPFGMGGFGGGGLGGGFGGGLGGFGGGMASAPARKPAVKVLETGVVGSLDYKILAAERADDLYTWLRTNRYHYAGDEATLDFYVRKKWFFTVMKIDAMQMKRKSDGSYTGEVTPTRFQFESDQLTYPLRITQISVKEKTEALFYVQAPFKVDLPGDETYQYQWLPMLQNAQGWYGKGGGKSQPGRGDEWLEAAKPYTGELLKRGEELGFAFTSGQRPQANPEGRIATTLEWAKRLTSQDIAVLRSQAPYTEKVPNVDEGFTARDVAHPRRGPAVRKVIENRLAQSRSSRPDGYLVRDAPDKDVKDLKILVGHLKEGEFLTKFRKTFTRAEMDDDLLLERARIGDVEDRSEYEEILPTSPP
jgi:hypothetical protein